MNFKKDTIRLIIENNGPKKYILFGDDTQKDLEVYSDIVKENAQRIQQVYIRQTKSGLSGDHKRIIKDLERFGVQVKLFKEDEYN